MIFIPVTLSGYTDCILKPIRSDEIAFGHDCHMRVITFTLVHKISMRYIFEVKFDRVLVW